MSLKTQILTQLKEHVKAKGINLSNVRINAFADRLDTIVDKEDAIKAEIEKLDALVDFKDLAALDDAKRQKEKKEAEDADKTGDKSDKADDKADDKSDKADKTDKDEAPAWFKAHTEQQSKVIETLTSRLEKFEKGEATKSRLQLVNEKLEKASDSLKTITQSAFKRMQFDTDADFDEYLAEIEQTVSADVQAQSDEGLGVDAPTKGLGGTGASKAASEAELDAVFSNVKI